jgi:hypothetical protein
VIPAAILYIPAILQERAHKKEESAHGTPAEDISIDYNFFHPAMRIRGQAQASPESIFRGMTENWFWAVAAGLSLMILPHVFLMSSAAVIGLAVFGLANAVEGIGGLIPKRVTRDGVTHDPDILALADSLRERLQNPNLFRTRAGFTQDLVSAWDGFLSPYVRKKLTPARQKLIISLNA